MKKLRKRLLRQGSVHSVRQKSTLRLQDVHTVLQVLEDEKPEEKLINDCIESSNK